MLKKKRLRSEVVHSGFLFVAALAAGLLFGCVQVAFAAEATSPVSESVSQKPASLRFAPIRFSVNTNGLLDYTYYYNANGVAQSLVLSVNSSVRARSFIWQPWFAPIDSNVGASYNGNLTNSGKSATGQLYGGVAVRLLPRSRYPAEVSFYKSRTRPISGTGSRGGFGTRHLAFSQGYRSRNQGSTGSVILGHTAIEDIPSAIKITDSFAMNVGHLLTSLQRVDVNWDIKREYSPYLGNRTLTGNLVARHDYKPSSVSAVRSVYNDSKVSNRQLGVASSSGYRQFNSVGYGVVFSGLTVVGGARVQSGISGRSRTSNMSLDTTYALTPAVRVSGGIKVSDELDIQRIATRASLTASKSIGDSKLTKLGVFTYRKYATGGVSASNSVVADNAAEQSVDSAQGVGLSASVGHSLTNSTSLYAGQLTSNVNQSIRASVNASGLGTLPLSTNALMRWLRVNEVSRSSTNARITASDTRYLRSSNSNNSTANNNSNRIFSTANLAAKQLVNLQVTHTQKPARFMVWNGDITVQFASYRGVRTANASAGLKYSHSRAFQIPRMVFSSALQTQYNLVADATQSQGQLIWNNGLAYSVGQLDLNLDVNMSRVGQFSQGYLRFKLRRLF